MARRCVPLLLCLLLALTGCQDARGASSQLPALNLGLDAGESHALRLTVQLPQIGQSGSGGSGGGSDGSGGSTGGSNVDPELLQKGYVLTQTEGETVEECLTLLSAALPREVTFLHLRGLYISESYAKSDHLTATLSSLIQSRKLRPGAAVYLCLGRAEDVLKALSPSLGTRLSKSLDSRLEELQSKSLIPDAYLTQVYEHMLGQGADAVAVLAAVNNKSGMEAALPGGLQPADRLAGELPYNSVNPVSFFGAAVFRGVKPTLYLSGYETQLMNLCMGRFEQGDLELAGDAGEETLALKQTRAPRLTVDMSEQEPFISLSLQVEASSYAGAFSGDPALLRARAQAQLEEDILNLLLRLQQAGCDPMDLEGAARMHTLTFAQWREMEWDTRYPLARFSVQVDLTLLGNAASIS